MDQQNVCSSPHILNVLGILHTVSVCVLESQFPVQLDWIHKTWAQPTAGLCKTCLALLSLSEYLQIPTFPFWSFSSPKQKVSHSIMMPNFLHSKMHIHLFFFFFKNSFIYYFWLCWIFADAQVFSSCRELGYSLAVVCELLIEVIFIVAELRL